MDWPWRQGHRGISLLLHKRFSQMRYKDEDLHSYASNHAKIAPESKKP